MERTFIEQLRAGTSIDQSFLVKAKSRRQKRTGEPFLTFLLIDRTGEIVGNLWEGFGEDEASIEAGDFVQVTAAVLSFQGSPQLNIQRIRKLSPEEIRREDFYPSTTKDTGEMSEYLRTVASSLENPYLRALVRSFLEDDAFMACFRQSPAAKGLHHAYVGGLLEHTASVLKVCEAILEHYRGVRRDLLLAGAILHDVGKVRELGLGMGIPDYTDEGRLLGHIVIGALMVDERLRTIPDFPGSLRSELLHILVSHHGEHVWGSPKRPKTLEALIVHRVEDLDAKLSAFQQYLAQSRDPVRPHWTSYHKVFERFLFRGDTEEEVQEVRDEP